MSQQVTLQKTDGKKADFLTASVYEKAVIPKSERFIVRQGDLIVTNYYLENSRSMGLKRVHALAILWACACVSGKSYHHSP